MMLLAVGLGVLGFCALRRARRRCFAASYGWYGPWAAHDGYDGWHGHGWHGDHGHHGHHRRHRRHWMMHAALARIDATPAQERVIVGELDQLADRIAEAKHQLAGARTDLAAALRGPVLDDAALGAVLGRVDGTTVEARTAMVEALRNVHAVLDDKQRAEVADLVERGRDRNVGSGRRGGAGWWRTGPYR